MLSTREGRVGWLVPLARRHSPLLRGLAHGAAALLLVATVVACSGAAATPTRSAPPVPTPTPTEAPTPTPRPTGFVEQQDGTFTWTTETGLVKDVPVISGLKQVKNAGTGVIEYHDAKTNSYIGQFQQFFRVDSEQTGNVVLKPSEVNKLIQKALAAFADQRDRYVAALPLDTRSATSDTKLQLVYTTGFGKYAYPIARVTFVGELPVTNIIPNTTQVMILKNTYEGYIYDWSRRGDAANAYTVVRGKEEYYLVVGGLFEGVSQTGNNTDAAFGARICNATALLDIVEGAGDDYRPMQGHVLTVANGSDQVPVAVAA